MTQNWNNAGSFYENNEGNGDMNNSMMNMNMRMPPANSMQQQQQNNNGRGYLLFMSPPADNGNTKENKL